MAPELATVKDAREALRACEERNTGGWIDCLERTTRLANTVIAQAEEIGRLRPIVQELAVQRMLLGMAQRAREALGE